ncbi:MAG: type IX secretion system protein PorQ [Flavobacteriales bacterium]|nr:type IX secretion system protein PorQ [Flavobacteriales bacterium]
MTAQTGGSTGFSFLQIPVSAREAALGGSYLAMRDGDMQLALRNPSLLDSLMHGDLAMTYTDYFSGSRMGHISYGHRIKPKLTLAGSISYLGWGRQDETDATGQVIGSFGADDMAFTAGAGYQIDSALSVGANVKALYSAIASQVAYGTALDAAITYHRPLKNFTASLLFRNLGIQFDPYRDTRADLPFEIQVGVTKRLQHAPFRFNVVAENLQKWDLTNTEETNATIDPITGVIVEDKGWEFGDKLMRHMTFGAEIILSENLHLRLGYNYRRRQELKVADRPGTSGLSYGIGVQIKKFQISYGRAIYHLAGPSNHFSISRNIFN